MARHKKNNLVQMEENKTEVIMTNGSDVLETLEADIDVARQELERTRLEIEEKKKELESFSNSRRELSEDEKLLVNKQVAITSKRASANANIERQKMHDNQMVTGRFMNRRNPGQQVKLCYHKYEDDPIKWYIFEEGKVYTIPRGFADQLNGGNENDPCHYTPRFLQKEGAQVLTEDNGGNSSIGQIDSSNKRYAFVPVGFSN